MTSRWTALAAMVLIGGGLGGCGGSANSDTPPALRDAASVLPSDLSQAASGDANLDGKADKGAALTPAEFCGFLAKESPEVIDKQPAEYTAATFNSALFTFYTDHGLLTDIDGVVMDALAAKGCPKAAAELLPVLGASSFAELLSR